MTVWRPLGNDRDGSAVMDAKAQARLSVPLGLALGDRDPLTQRFNLRQEELAKRSAVPDRRFVIPFLAGLLLLGVLFGFRLHQETGILEARHEAIRTEMREIILTTFPETPMVIKGQEAAQMEQKIQEQRARHGWLDQLTPEHTVLDLLTVISSTLAAHKDVTIDNVSVDDREVPPGRPGRRRFKLWMRSRKSSRKDGPSPG